jgi:hypothetical protein
VSRPAVPALVLGFAAIVVAAAVVGGVWVMGSPSEQRLRRMDAQRVEDLRVIAGYVKVYWKRHERVPATLEELSGEPGVRFTSKDPATGAGYEYQAGEGDAYRLCATFARDSDTGEGARSLLYGGFDEWNHGAGRQCFDRRAG